jgi:hypothetical protein
MQAGDGKEPGMTFARLLESMDSSRVHMPTGRGHDMARRCMRCVGGGGDGGHGDGLGQACRVTATLIPRAHDGGT